VRTLVKKSFEEALKRYDVLISPAAPSAAYKIGMLLFAHVISSSPKNEYGPFLAFFPR
jgi:Asp-tRNA(Asn)/Glu-tRNA(Gln) amidotransferase A subunit family amidase